MVPPCFLVQSFYWTLWEMCWRIKKQLVAGWWHRKVPFEWSGQRSIDLSVRHGLGLSGCISRARQPAPARASADQRRTWTLVLLARAHVSVRNDCWGLKMENKCKAGQQSWQRSRVLWQLHVHARLKGIISKIGNIQWDMCRLWWSKSMEICPIYQYTVLISCPGGGEERKKTMWW